MDPRGRMMLHRPWNEDGGGQPAFVILEVIEAYSEAGGSLEKLISLLNKHIRGPSFILDESGLMDDARYYSLEFYFYLCQFCKRLLNDPGFRYKGDREQLSVYHYITEKGPMDFPPWYSDGNRRDGYLSLSNIRSMIIYVEERMELRNWKGDSIDGRKISEDLLLFINQCVDKRYRVSRSFFDKESILISFEYLFYISSLIEYLTNTTGFYSDAFHYGFHYNNHLAEAIFLQPGVSTESGMKEWFERTNSTYDLEIKKKKGNLIIDADISRQLKTGMFERYEKNCIHGIMQAVPAVWYSFTEMATERKVKMSVIPPESGSSRFQVSISWKSRRSILLGICWSILAALIMGTILYKTPSSGLFPIVIAVVTGIIHYLGYRDRLKLKRTEKRYKKTGETVKRQIDALQTITGELLKERDSLEEAVKTRTTELEEALEQLKALDRGKTNFVANVSHELRTPLTLLTVPMEEIRRGRYGASLPRDHQVFTLMERNILRLRTQINQLLDFTRLDMGEHPFHPVPINILTYCQNLTVELKSQVESKGLYLKVRNTTGLSSPVISADPILFESLMLNLLNNAVKFTDRGGVSLILEKNDDSMGKLSLTVKDTGIGFSEHDSQRIFERFTQAEENKDRHYEGTGLGLALVKEIVALHGWEIQALGTPGQGASFTITVALCSELPMEEISILTKRKLLSSTTVSPSTSQKKGADTESEILMLVEDSPDMASLLKDLLGNEYTLIWCSSGPEALDCMEKEGPFSLVICDMMMPGMDGLDFRESFLKKTGNRELPFIYLTALADNDVRRRALASGAPDYIAKPFGGDELRLKIHNLLEVRRLGYRQALKDSRGSERLLKMKELESRDTRKKQLEGYDISSAEQRVLELLKQGLQDKEIADSLSISPRTVSTHLRNLYKKTGAQNRIELLNLVYS